MTDNYCQSNNYKGEERRRHCEMIIELSTQYQEEKKMMTEWRKEVNGKLDLVLAFMQKVEPKYNAGLWTIRIIVGAIVLAIIGFFLEWIKNNIQIKP